ncbi:Hypothetical predicted protein [Mytilus galloprovincialis]|uniref:Peptidase A2 domain-containing protein n=1 Tax=Mytilus galloprovincialis TaxID=29158 RepID=A0A8B6GSY2_MYTGA|nr:Hypothetical predicted protein [Mytilus galloprovincialis]
MEEYKPFIPDGLVSIVDDTTLQPIKILRDTGASQSLLLEGVLPLSEKTSVGASVLLQGVGLGCIDVPPHRIYLKSDLITGPVVVGIRPNLPVEGVTYLLGNDLARNKVVAELYVTSEPVVDVKLPEDDAELYPACVVTRAMARKQQDEDLQENQFDYMDLSDTFLADIEGPVYKVDNGCLVKGKCHRSQRKNESPHDIEIILLDGPILQESKCSCAIGKLGTCGHVTGLLYSLAHMKTSNYRSIPTDVLKTSLPQSWYMPRGEKLTNGVSPTDSVTLLNNGVSLTDGMSLTDDVSTTDGVSLLNNDVSSTDGVTLLTIGVSLTSGIDENRRPTKICGRTVPKDVGCNLPLVCPVTKAGQKHCECHELSIYDDGFCCPKKNGSAHHYYKDNTLNGTETNSPEHTISLNGTETNSPEHTISRNLTETNSPEHIINRNLTETNSPEHTTSRNLTETNSPEHTTSRNLTETNSPEHTTSRNLTETNSPEHTTSQTLEEETTGTSKVEEGIEEGIEEEAEKKESVINIYQ